MEKVCATIDAQGFTFNKEFKIREVAVCSPYYKQNTLCNTGLTYGMMSYKDKSSNYYVSSHLLGLTLGRRRKPDKPNITDDGEQMIVLMYEKVKAKNKKVVAIKNDQIEPILSKLGIPYLKLEKYDCPNYDLLKEIYNDQACHFHDLEIPYPEKLRCSEQKASILWRWLLDYKKNDF